MVFIFLLYLELLSGVCNMWMIWVQTLL